MKRKPRVIRVRAVLACLVFAVVVAVGSVPVLAVWFDRAPSTYPGRDGAASWLSKGPDRGAMYWRSSGLGVDEWRYAGAAAGVLPTPSDDEVQADPRPAWARPREDADTPIYTARSIGWPLRSADGWRFQSVRSRQIAGPFWLIQQPSRGFEIEGRSWSVSIPIVPRWPGLLANAVFFFAIPFAPWTLLRWRRISRIERLGLCYKCQYEFPREIKTCPECGMARPPARERDG